MTTFETIRKFIPYPGKRLLEDAFAIQIAAKGLESVDNFSPRGKLGVAIAGVILALSRRTTEREKKQPSKPSRRASHTAR